jgi:carboxyl-terminal processing protease
MQAVTNGALRGLLESLDADSSYLTPADYKAYKADKGGKAQVGLNVSKRYGYATVVSVVPGSPADRANFTDGDIIEAIGTEDTRDLSLAMIKLLLEGPPGSEVTLAVIRPRKADPDKVVLKRVMVTEPPVVEAMYDGSSILYLKPVILDKEHVNQVEAKLKSMDKDGNKKVLLDLRDVSAGDMPEAVRLANFFVKSGTIATLEGQTVARETFAANPAKVIVPSAPLAVLVNRGTSGPGEIVAAALLDDKRGEVIGEKTFGEGAQQKTFELPDGAALILTVAKYESPSGSAIQDNAVTPEMLVASSADLDIPDDSDAAKPAQPAVPQPDDPLNKAIEYLKAKSA